VRAERERREAEVEMDGMSADYMYSELLSRYVEHWGVTMGSDLLNNEIAAYRFDGVGFSEAVKRVYARNKSSIRR
jgi:hypothetical protein